MPLERLKIKNYRSLRDLHLPIGRLTVVTGPNGVGKTNLYRALWLISRAARGELARALAHEGGMPSALWSGGTEVSPKLRMQFTVAFDDFTYSLACGLPGPTTDKRDPSLFLNDPEVKEESVHASSPRGKSSLMMQRDHNSAFIRDEQNRMVAYPAALDHRESILAQLQEPHRYPELFALRLRLMRWRFYHTFLSDADSPLRKPQVRVQTPVLSDDAHDLVSALRTIHEIGDRDRMYRAIEEALPGIALLIAPVFQEVDRLHAPLEITMIRQGMHRRLEAHEFSDGTLRYLCLVAALLSPRPAEFLALNEPETSLHPDLLRPLAALLVDAARTSQVWVTTHSTALAAHIAECGGAEPLRLEMRNGATIAPQISSLGERLEEE